MKETVLLTKAQADALERLKKVWNNNTLKYRSLVKEKLNGGWNVPEWKAANDINDNDFFHALYVGYEIVMSEDEKLRSEITKEYKAVERQMPQNRDRFDRGYLSGFRHATNFILRKQKKDEIINFN